MATEEMCPDCQRPVSKSYLDDEEAFCFATGNIANCVPRTIARLRAELEARGDAERCGGTSQMGCGCEVWMGAKGLATQPIGYRCSECEQPFCASCIKGKKHTERWQEPCHDAELENWANQAIAAQKQASELRAELDALKAPRIGPSARSVAWAEGYAAGQRDMTPAGPFNEAASTRNPYVLPDPGISTMPTPQELLEYEDPSQCAQLCDHGSRCALPADHLPATRHETEHGCICYSDVSQAVLDARAESKRRRETDDAEG